MFLFIQNMNARSAIVSPNFGLSYLSVNTRKTKYILENFLTLIDREVLFFYLLETAGASWLVRAELTNSQKCT